MVLGRGTSGWVRRYRSGGSGRSGSALVGLGRSGLDDWVGLVKFDWNFFCEVVEELTRGLQNIEQKGFYSEEIGLVQ